MQRRYNIVGYGVCGANEKRLTQTLDEFARLCDHVVIVGNNIDGDSKKEILARGFTLWEDNREWGKFQNRIKQDAVIRLSEFSPDWVIALDMDETFDETLTREELEKLCDRGGYGYFFYIINLYEDGYSAEWSFWNNRMFRYDKSLNFSPKPLHCGLAPELHWRYSNYAPFIVWHYGLKDKEDRDRKVARYAQYDPTAQNMSREYYDFLASKSNVSPLDTEMLRTRIKDEVTNYHFKSEIKETIMSERIYYYVKNPAGVILDIPEYQLQETLARPGFSLVSDTPIGVTKTPVATTEVKTEPPVVEESIAECDVCGYIAKSKFGLLSHKRKHD